MKVKNYLFPETVEECLNMLSESEGLARIIAGGTDLYLLMEKGKESVPETLIDITRIEELQELEVQEDHIVVGACRTHADIASDSRLAELVPSFCEGCSNVGSPQIRNLGTIGGNIVSAQPAADAVVPLVALGAKCEIAGREGRRIEPLESLNERVGKSRVDPSKEIITKVVIENPGNKINAFGRIAPREAMALPVVNAAVSLECDQHGTVTAARIVIAPVARTPFIAERAAEHLEGKKINDKACFTEAARIAGDDAQPRDSLVRGSGEYRKDLVRRLVEDTLLKAAEKSN